jgi:predicted transcriptional regulator
MNLNEIIETLHPLERKVIPYLKNSKSLRQLQKNSRISEVEATRALQWLENKGIVKITKKQSNLYSLDKNGKVYTSKKLPELQFLAAIKNRELSLNQIEDSTGLSKEELNISLGLLKKQGAIGIQKGMKISINSKGLKLLDLETPEQKLIDKLMNPTSNLNSQEKNTLKQLLKRKNMVKKDIISVSIFLVSNCFPSGVISISLSVMISFLTIFFLLRSCFSVFFS